MEVDTLHFRSVDSKYIYLLICGVHCDNPEKFYKIFPKSKQITVRRFDRLYKRGAQIVCVGDEHDIRQIERPEGSVHILN